VKGAATAATFKLPETFDMMNALQPSSPSAPSARVKKSPPAWLLSVICSGVGHIAHGRVTRGLTLYGVDLAASTAALAIMLYWPVEQWNAIAAVTLVAGVRLGIIWDGGFRRALMHKQPARSPLTLWPVMLIAGLTFAVCYAMSMRAVWCEAFFSPSGGMYATIIPGDRLLADKLAYRLADIQRGDVVVFRSDEAQQLFVGRVIALGGETIELRDEIVYIDGQLLDEPYVYLHPESEESSTTDPSPQAIPAEHVFIMGDNRRRAMDSRFRGPVAVDDVTGRVCVIYWSAAEPTAFEVFEADPPPGTTRWGRVGNRLGAIKSHQDP
jgi:signal peptidase I